MAIVTTDDLAPLWPGGTLTDPTRVGRLITLAEAAIAAKVPNLAARIQSGDLDRDLLVLAVYKVVRRELSITDDGAKSVAITRGPFTESRGYDTATSSTFVTDDDVQDLLPLTEQADSQWGSVGVGLQSYQLPRRQRYHRPHSTGQWGRF